MTKFSTILLIVVLGLFSCAPDKDSDAISLSNIMGIEGETIAINPSGYSPLTAKFEFKTEQKTRYDFLVLGQNGKTSDYQVNSDQFKKEHSIIISGLYPNYTNRVIFKLYDESDNLYGVDTLSIKTILPEETLPRIIINKRDKGLKPGLNLISYLGHDVNPLPNKPIIFDEFGDIRWYLDYSNHPILKELTYNNGISKLNNGNYYFGDKVTDKVYEVDLTGEIIEEWTMGDYEFHHEVYEKPNGNFLITATKKNTPSINDQLLEIDRTTKKIIKTWDFRAILDPDRNVWPRRRDNNWLHLNSVFYDEKDSTVLVSGRLQGVFKVDYNDDLKWILAPHKGWNTKLSPKLLHPLNKQVTKITDSEVLSGDKVSEDFEWNWYQHSARVANNGQYFLFDNGDQRNYKQNPKYSRGVIYSINEQNKSVSQDWSFGKSLEQSFYSRIVSEIDIYEDVNHTILTSGSISNYGKVLGRIIEIDLDNDKVLFDATIVPPNEKTRVALHRSQRIPSI